MQDDDIVMRFLTGGGVAEEEPPRPPKRVMRQAALPGMEECAPPHCAAVATHAQHMHVWWSHCRSTAHPGKALARGAFTTSKLQPVVPAGMVAAAAAAPPHAPLIRGWTWVPPTAWTDTGAARDAAVARMRVFQRRLAANAPGWQRAAAAKHMLTVNAGGVEDVGHTQGYMPCAPRAGWPNGARCMYRNADMARDSGGMWLPRGLACAALPAAVVAKDGTSDGAPFAPLPPGAGDSGVQLMERLHQPQAVDAVLGHWAGAAAAGQPQSCIVLMPCGYGKSVTAMAIARAAGRRCVWIVPRRVLGHDAMDAAMAMFPGAVKWTKRSAAKRAAEGGAAAFTVAFMDGAASEALHPRTSGVDILVVSVHTLLSRCGTFSRRDWGGYGTLVVDEAHMVPWRAMHALSIIPARRVVALSATPYRGDGTTAALYWAFGPLVFACRRPASSLCGEVWRWNGAVPTVYISGAADATASTNKLCTDALRLASLVNTVHAAINTGRHTLLMATRVEYMSTIAATVTRERPGDAWTVVPLPAPFTCAPAQLDKLLAEGVRVNLDEGTVAVAPAACINGETPVKLRNIVLGAARCVCAHPNIAKVGLSCRTLDTLIVGTPLADPEQIVGRITRANSVGQTPVVIDFVDPHEPFLGMWSSREAAYEFLDMSMQYVTVTQGVTVAMAAARLAPYSAAQPKSKPKTARKRAARK
jgi:hypothetical protein